MVKQSNQTPNNSSERRRWIRNALIGVSGGALAGVALAALRNRFKPIAATASTATRPIRPPRYSPPNFRRQVLTVDYEPSDIFQGLKSANPTDELRQLSAGIDQEVEQMQRSLSGNRSVSETVLSLPSTLGTKALPPSRPALVPASGNRNLPPYLGIIQSNNLNDQFSRLNNTLRRSVWYGLLSNDEIGTKLSNASTTISSLASRLDSTGPSSIPSLVLEGKTNLRNQALRELLVAGDNEVISKGRLTFNTNPGELFDKLAIESFINDYLLENPNATLQEAFEVISRSNLFSGVNKQALLDKFKTILSRGQESALSANLKADITQARRFSGLVPQIPPRRILPDFARSSPRPVDTSNLFQRIRNTLADQLMESVASQPSDVRSILQRIDEVSPEEAQAAVDAAANWVRPSRIVGDLSEFEPVALGNPAAAYKLASQNINKAFIESIRRRSKELQDVPYSALRRILDRGFRDELYTAARIAQSRMDRELFPIPVKLPGYAAGNIVERDKVSLIGFSATPTTKKRRIV